MTPPNWPSERAYSQPDGSTCGLPFPTSTSKPTLVAPPSPTASSEPSSVVSSIKSVRDIEDWVVLRKILDYAGPRNIQQMEIRQFMTTRRVDLKISSSNLPNLTTLFLRNVPLHLLFNTTGNKTVDLVST